MNKKTVSYGKCFFCKKTYASSGMSRHLNACKERVGANLTESGRSYQLFTLRIWGEYAPDFWMHIEIPSKATLADLDDFLRAVWLECCGHLSLFNIRGECYTENPALDREWGMDNRSNRVALERVVEIGEEFDYEYDFGTTTPLKLKVISERQGKAKSKKDIRILARNFKPDFRCGKCNQPATLAYVFDYPSPLFCEKHALERDSGEEGLMPLVNSPRWGECGYTGPYDEKYIFEEIYTP